MDKQNPQYKTLRKVPDDRRQAQADWLREQIPVTHTDETVILPLVFFQQLSDDQLRILAKDVDLEIRIGKKTERYLRKRLIAIGVNPKTTMRDEQAK